MTARDLRLRPTTDGDEWDRLVDAADGATPFHRFAWLTTMAGLCGWRFRPLIAEHRGVPVGVVPVLVREHLPLSPSMPFPYCGPLVPEHLLDGTIAALRTWQVRHGHLVAELSFAPTRRGPAASPGVQSTEQRTYVLDLSHGDPEVYRRGLHRDRMKGLRRAARLGLEHRASTPADTTRVLPRLLEEAYVRHDGRSPYAPLATADWIAQRLADRDGGMVAQTVVDGGEPVAVLVALREGDRAYGWLGGALPGAQASGAGTLAYDAMIRRLLAEGVQQLDLVGHVDEGVARFKRTLGAVEAGYRDVRSSLLPATVELLGRRAWASAAARRTTAQPA